MKQGSTYALAGLSMSILSANAGDLLENWHCRQCVVVTTASWAASKGTMSIFERGTVDSHWQQRRSTISVVVGKAGLAWGVGLPPMGGSAEQKKEGDNKAPAGVFVLSGVFGYAPSAPTRMPYLPLSPNIVGVDDPQSRFY